MTFKSILLIATATFSLNTLACDKPGAPELPNPDQAVTAQMIKAKNDVKAYIKAAESYLACMKDTAKYNSMVDEMQVTADQFNSIVRKYKARMAAG